MELNLKELAMMVSCSKCQARPGAPCRHLTAHPMGLRPAIKSFHAERIDSARDLKEIAEHE